MQFATRQRLFNACDPATALDPGDSRCVDLDGPWGDPPARGVDWSDVLAKPIATSTGPSQQLLTAIPGSGVSTELLRLASKLGDPAGANLLVARADAARVSDLMSPIDIADVLLLVVSAVQDAVARASGAPAPEVHRYLRDFVPESLVLPPGERLDGSRLLAEIRLVASFRERLRANVSAGFSRFLAAVRSALVGLRDTARGQGRAGILVMVDSLERLGGSLDTRAAVLASAERLFGADAGYLGLPVHTLYTLPPALLPRLRGVQTLPALRVFGRDGRPDEAGFAAARALVRARLPDEVLDPILGATAREDRVRRMIERTAGVPRDLVKLLQRMVARHSLDEPAFEQILGEVGETAARLLLARSYPGLARVHASGALPPSGDSADLDLALEVGALVPYRDGQGEWFGVAPAVVELAGVAEEIARVQTAA